MSAASIALDTVQRRGNASTPVVGRRRDVLVVLAAEALQRGWSTTQLVDALSDPLHDVKSVYAVLRHRLVNLGAPPPPPPAQQAPQSPATRQLHPGEDGRPVLGRTPPEEFAATSRRGRALVDAALTGGSCR